MMDKKDVLGFFTRLRASGSDADMLGLVEELDIVPLDVNRMYRILDRFSGADE